MLNINNTMLQPRFAQHSKNQKQPYIIALKADPITELSRENRKNHVDDFITRLEQWLVDNNLKDDINVGIGLYAAIGVSILGKKEAVKKLEKAFSEELKGVYPDTPKRLL